MARGVKYGKFTCHNLHPHAFYVGCKIWRYTCTGNKLLTSVEIKSRGEYFNCSIKDSISGAIMDLSLSVCMIVCF